MELSEAKSRLRAIKDSLASAPWVEFHAFEREGRILHVAITERLRKSTRKEGVWRSREMLATLKVIPESVSRDAESSERSAYLHHALRSEDSASRRERFQQRCSGLPSETRA